MKTSSNYPLLFLLFLQLHIGTGWAQTDSVQTNEMPFEPEKSSRFQIKGYIKNMQTWIFLENPDLGNFLQGNLIHQRSNLQWSVTEHWTFKTDLRTRIFYGDLVRSNPNFVAELKRSGDDYAKLSSVLLDEPAWVIHSMLDRMYLEYSNEQWELRLGRQRINWGISTVWNPNDIFNAFAFTDFDYEERPGTDALRVRYFAGTGSSIELAVKAFDHWKDAVIAGMWKFNARQFDWQILAGYMLQDAVLGVGWAGNLGDAGLKGEATFFQPLQSTASSSFAMTLASDYSFKNGLYLHGGYLYNSRGNLDGNIASLFNFELSAKNLYPYRHAIFLQGAYALTPLLNSGLALIYSPVKAQAMFINPSLTLSIAENWDLDCIGQIVTNRQSANVYSSPLQAVFLRIRYSF